MLSVGTTNTSFIILIPPNGDTVKDFERNGVALILFSGLCCVVLSFVFALFFAWFFVFCLFVVFIFCLCRRPVSCVTSVSNASITSYLHLFIVYTLAVVMNMYCLFKAISFICND